MTLYRTYIDNSTNVGAETILEIETNGYEYGIGISSDIVCNNITANVITANQYNGTISGFTTYAATAGVSTSVIGGIGSITQLQVTGISTFVNGSVLIGSGTSTGTASQPLQVTGGAYVSENLGIGTTNPTSKLSVIGDSNISGIITASQMDLTANGVNNDGVLSITGTVASNSRNGLLSVGTLATGLSDKGLLANFAANQTDYVQIILQNTNTGTTASTDVIVNNDAGGATTNYGDFGINSSGYVGNNAFADPNGTYLYAAGGTLSIGTNDARDFKIATGSAVATPVTRMTITGTTGRIGIGTTTPVQPFQVGAGLTSVVIDSTGDIGIGTTTPSAKLNIGAATTSAAGNAPLKIESGGTANLLATPEIGAIEYDGEFLYHTPNATSGRSYFPPTYSFRRATNGANIGAAIADFFTSPSSLSLEGSSNYIIRCFCYFTKNTQGTATWTHVFSSAPTLFTARLMYSPVSGIANGSQTNVLAYASAQAQTSIAHAATANLTTAVNHFAFFEINVITNAATNWRIRLTQSAGTATPLAGSYYTVEEVANSTGTFVA